MRAWNDPQRRLVLLVGAGLMLVLAVWALGATGTAPVDSFTQCAQAGYAVSDTNPPICQAEREIYLGPVHPPASPPVALNTQTSELLVDGDSHSNFPRRWQVITNQAGWVQYWSQIHAALPSVPPLLPVDFTTQDVVALSEGHEPTSGYSLKVTNVAAGSGGAVVDISESVPTITCAVTPNPPTNRYYIVQTAKLPQIVSFRVTEEPRHCR